MTNAGCPSVHVTTSDVTAAFLSQPPASGKALIDRQASLRHYARSDDVIDVSPGTGNDYFHQHRRHQFRQLSTAAAPRGQVTGTCRSDVIDHVYESPNLDKPAALCSLQNEHITWQSLHITAASMTYAVSVYRLTHCISHRGGGS